MAEGVAIDSNLPLFSAEEVQQHSIEKDAWIIHRGKVYDVSEFLESHPGGKVILLAVLTTQDKFHKHATFGLCIKLGRGQGDGGIGTLV